MIRIKKLSWPLISAIFVAGAGSLNAELEFELSTHKSFRQQKSGAINFLGGEFDLFFRDGSLRGVAGCDYPFYIGPNASRVCSGGTTAYLTFGELTNEDLADLADADYGYARRYYGPYFWITDVIPALAVEPRRPDLCVLYAAPASKLKRPASDFGDQSFGVYYNLHDKNNVVESIITRYTSKRTYAAGQWAKFNEEIVPGVYHYSFPRLHNEIVKVPLPATIYPMVDGYHKKNNQKTGVKFIPNKRWSKRGFMELSYVKPNVIKWTGFTPSSVYASVDTLHFALRFIKDPKDPNSPVIKEDPVTGAAPASLFPSFVNNGGDPRVALVNPFVTSFTLPPILKSGSKAVAELSLDRAFQTGGVTYDSSTRVFQIPVEVVNRYTDYAETRFGTSTKNTGVLDDNDKDGFNNLTEWILGSRAEDEFSVPVNPVTENHVETDNYFYYWFYYYYDYYRTQWFGFIFDKVQRNVPVVNYTLQRSANKGKSWSTFTSDADWDVTDTPEGYLVQSKVYITTDVYPYYTYIQPPGTEGHLYRLKITLKK